MNLKYSLALFFCAFTSLNEIVRWTVSDFPGYNLADDGKLSFFEG